MTIHVATTEELGRAVRRGIREPVGVVADNLLVGPCAAAAEAHVEARCAYWGLKGRERSRFVGAARAVLQALASGERVVVWTSGRWADTVAMFAVCAWRLASWPMEPDMDVVVLGGPGGSGFGPQVVRVLPADARRGRGEARSLSLTRVRELARSWRRLSSASPILAGARAPVRQPLAALGGYQAGFFPGVVEGRLVLSRFDALLFSCVGEGWSTPLNVFVRRGEAGEELRKWSSFTGDVFLAARMAQWAGHGGGEAALESEPHRAENVMKAARYRLSEAGRALLREGLVSLDRGAPLPVWGGVAYDPRAGWVVVGEHAGRQRLRRLGEPTPPDAEG